MQAQPCGVIVFFDLVVAMPQLAAFPAVGFFDGGRERLRDGVGWGHERRFRVSLCRFSRGLGSHGGWKKLSVESRE